MNITRNNVVIELSNDELKALHDAFEIVDSIWRETHKDTIVAIDHGGAYDLHDVSTARYFIKELGFNNIKLIKSEE